MKIWGEKNLMTLFSEVLCRSVDCRQLSNVDVFAQLMWANLCNDFVKFIVQEDTKNLRILMPEF